MGQVSVKLEYYQTNLGVFLRNPWGMSYNSYSGVPHFELYKFNGKVYSNTLRSGYLFLEGLQSIDKVETKVAAKQNKIGYEVKEEAPEALKASLKPYYSLEECGYYLDDGDACFKNEEFKAIRSMYKESYEIIPEYWEERGVTHVVLGNITVDNWQEPEKMEIKFHAEGSWNNKIETADLSSVVCYSDIERILTPGFLLHNRPCSLTSDQVYKIVRAHIKDNINPANAVVTPDYDFCFTVKRKVKHTPVTTKTEIKKQNGRRYATPKFSTHTTSYKEIEIFEMTPASKKYGTYTVIKGWQADNLLDMQEQLKYYLDMLMEEINADVQQCQHCHGVGAIVNKIGTNKRETT